MDPKLSPAADGLPIHGLAHHGLHTILASGWTRLIITQENEEQKQVVKALRTCRFAATASQLHPVNQHPSSGSQAPPQPTQNQPTQKPTINIPNTQPNQLHCHGICSTYFHHRFTAPPQPRCVFVSSGGSRCARRWPSSREPRREKWRPSISQCSLSQLQGRRSPDRTGWGPGGNCLGELLHGARGRWQGWKTRLAAVI